ncbi:phosphatidylinositol 4-kinase [Cryptococcus neoformans AD1-7a]|nr:phosphatidylinositol 4-kinase [Cryptococcus neoformans var. grubii AD1-7a]
MSHALLLRLFLSPYFSISIAMQYLKTYPDSIGISHYLCWRMKRMPAEEVEFYWPQICHLLLTYPTQSNALESFIIARAEESTHSAMLTFWFMQAALRDLIPTRQTDPVPFAICQRVLHRCHAIIFGDPPEPSRSPYRSLPHSPSSSALGKLSSIPGSGSSSTFIQIDEGQRQGQGLGQGRVNPHAAAALVGMGVMFAGIPGMPALVPLVGEWALIQGRRPMDDLTSGRDRVEVDTGGGADVRPEKMERRRKENENERGEKEDSESEEEDGRAPSNGIIQGQGYKSNVKFPKSTVNLAITGPAQTTPNLYSPPRSPSAVPPFSAIDMPDEKVREKEKNGGISSRRKGSDPFGQLFNDRSPTPPKSAHQPFHSVPSLPRSSSYNPNHYQGGPPTAEAILATYSFSAQRQLLTSHYCRSEVRFLLLLEDISNRLLVIPKPARVSALRAELTSLNHNLPAEVCMPLWCTADHTLSPSSSSSTLSPSPASGSNNPSSSAKNRAYHPRGSAVPGGHSRVVRISPGDSVVLNSAERAPYLLHVEILQGDLNFDPTRRENRELLKKIVVAEDRKRKKRDGTLGVGVDGREAGSGGRVRNAGYNNGRQEWGLGSKKGKGKGEGFGSLMPDSIPAIPPSPSPASASISNSSKPPSQPPLTATTTTPGTPKPIPPEEMDLVEQLYGTLSVHDEIPDLSEIIPLPSGPKNRDLDMKAWDRGSPVPGRITSSGVGVDAGAGIGAGVMGDVGQWMSSPTGTATGSEVGKSGPSTPGFPSAKSGFTSPSPSSSSPFTPGLVQAQGQSPSTPGPKRAITLEDYSERMRTAAVMLAQLNASLVPNAPENQSGGGWIPGTGWIRTPGGGGGGGGEEAGGKPDGSAGGKLKLAAAQAAAIRERIMLEMMALEEERVERMTDRPPGADVPIPTAETSGGGESGHEHDHEHGTAEDEGIVRRELNKADPSAAVFRESWSAKKSRIRAGSPWGHLANWDVISVIVKTGADLRQEQLATQLIERFSRIWKEENCDCWARFFRILITGETSGLVETVTDAVSVHSIKKGEYAKRLAEGGPIGHVSLMDHYVNTFGKPDSGRFARAQRNFIRSLAGYSIITYLLQIKDRHNGNILVDQDGHLIHIDFGFMLSNSPGNMGFEAAPFKMLMEYVDIMGGLNSPGYAYFKKLFKEGFEAARKHSDSLITIVELMQKNSKLDCFALFGDQTAAHFRERFQLGLTTQAVDAYLERLIVTSTGSNYTKLYDTFQYYSQGVL